MSGTHIYFFSLPLTPDVLYECTMIYLHNPLMIHGDSNILLLFPAPNIFIFYPCAAVFCRTVGIAASRGYIVLNVAEDEIYVSKELCVLNIDVYHPKL